MNSLFQVAYPSGGHQPLGFDQLTPLYQKYRVMKCHWKVRILPNNVTPALGTVLVVLPINNQTSTYTSISEIAEKAGAVSKICNNYDPVSISGSCNLASLTGRTHREYMADDVYAANVTASPGEIMLLHFMVASNDNATSTIGSFFIELQFDTEFYDPLQPGPS